MGDGEFLKPEVPGQLLLRRLAANSQVDLRKASEKCARTSACQGRAGYPYQMNIANLD
jgi:hypothetical protein